MQVKKKYNHGGIHSWPPDTEVMASDNTAVSSPQLNFLANQLLPAQVTSNIEAEMLNREGIPAVSTQPGRPSQEYVRAMNMLSIERRNFQAQVDALVDQGFTEEAARQHIENYAAAQAGRTPGTATSVAPVMEFLSPAGDVMAMAEAVGQAIEGNVGAAGVTGGLATAAIFFPGRIPADRISDDIVRSMAASNARSGVVSNKVPDIVEYIQEIATSGNISFGATRSRALGGGPREFREPPFGSGYMRDFLDRPYSTNPAFAPAGIRPDQPYQSGRSVGSALSETGNRIGDLELEQTRDILQRALGMSGDPNIQINLNDDQIDYYQGIIDEITLNIPGPGQTRMDIGPRPFRRERSVQDNDPYGVTNVRQRPGSSGSAAAAQGKPSIEEVELGKLGDNTLNTYNINRADPADMQGSALMRMRTQPGSQSESNVAISMTAYREADGLIDHDFYLNSAGSKTSRKFDKRVRELENEGLSMEEAMIKATKEVDAAINEGLKRMYGEVPVGQNIKTTSYSADSYPLMLQGVKGGKYQTIGPVGGAETAALDASYTGGVKMSSLNTMGDNLLLFKRLKSSDFGDLVDRVKAVDNNWSSRVQQHAEQFLRGKPQTVRNIQAAGEYAIKKRMLTITKGYVSGVEQSLQEEIGNAFADHINKQINEINEDSVNALIRFRADDKGIPLQEAEVEIMNEFIPLPSAKYNIDSEDFRVPTPRIKKIRAEEGAYLTVPKFRMKKKKAAYGMRVKK